ncbi:MAG: nucleotide exchange factor GrpE [Bacteroidota bacterium]
MSKKEETPNTEEQVVETTPEEQVDNTSAKATEKKSKRSKRSKTAKLEAALEELTAEHNELKDKYIRQVAEFDNFRKRNAKERIELIKTAGSEVIRDLLPVLDDIDRAIKVADAEDNDDSINDGVRLVFRRLHTILQGKGLQEIESTGEAFNPEVHEAVTEFPAPTEEQKGKVFDTIEKGYTLNDKIIRFPKVVVGK